MKRKSRTPQPAVAKNSTYPPILDKLDERIVTLIQDLKYGSPDLQKRAVEALLGYGKDALPHLEPLLQHSDWKVQIVALRVLGKMDGPCIVDNLNSRDENVRYRTALTLEELDSLDDSVAPKLKKAIESEPNRNIRNSLVRTLERLGFPV